MNHTPDIDRADVLNARSVLNNPMFSDSHVEISKGLLLRLISAAEREIDRRDAAQGKPQSAISWGGFNLCGDEKSVRECRRLLDRAGRCVDLEREIVEARKANQGARAVLKHVIDCWEAAEVEGLREAIADAKNVRSPTAERLADLLERRISHGIADARAFLDGSRDDITSQLLAGEAFALLQEIADEGISTSRIERARKIIGARVAQVRRE